MRYEVNLAGRLSKREDNEIFFFNKQYMVLIVFNCSNVAIIMEEGFRCINCSP